MFIKKEFLEYLRDNPEGYWFKARWYGYGWVPATWQGYVSLIFFILITVLDGIFLSYKTSSSGEVEKSVSIIFFVVLFFSVFGLIFLCFKKGEPPAWNWGDPRKKKSKRQS